MPVLKPPHGEERSAGARLEPRMAAQPAGQRVCLGVIVGAHGVRGAVRIKSFTAKPRDVARYGQLEEEAGERRFSLRVAGQAAGVVIARIAGITDRNQAEELRGLRLYLPRAALPPAGKEEYYHADLIGLAVVLADGTSIGEVRAVYDFGAGDTLDIARPVGQPVMVPFTRAVVPSVDLASGQLVIHPPPGLLEPEKALPRTGPRRRPGSINDAPRGREDGSRPAPGPESGDAAVEKESAV
jgi:16S rRNA processing protein RimM